MPHTIKKDTNDKNKNAFVRAYNNAMDSVKGAVAQATANVRPSGETAYTDSKGNHIIKTSQNILPYQTNEVDDGEAVDHYKKTGEHLGKFNSVKEANAYAKLLHDTQKKRYGK